jgi:hypothetical protein
MRRIALFVAVVALACCSRGEPQSRVQDLNWACGPRTCSAKFRVANESRDDEALVLRVRAYAGDSVANRRTVGEHRESLTLPAGQTRRFAVTLETQQPATRLRVIIERGS